MDQILNDLVEWFKRRDGVEIADRIEGENAIGVELKDGTEYFVSIEPA